MNRIFYFNLNYQCNNKCRFCFSYNTFNTTAFTVAAKDIVNIIEVYKPNRFDRVVINGGEPTLNKDLSDIISLFHKCKAEIVLFTNGIKLADLDYCRSIADKVDRIVIPVHGSEETHDYVTQNLGSYKSTIKAIKNIVALGYGEKIELKFIVTEVMIRSNLLIPNFLKEIGTVRNIVLTNQVNTTVSKQLKFLSPTTEQFGAFISKQLPALIGKYNIKLIECRICQLSEEIQAMLEEMPKMQDETFDDYIFFDGKYKDGRHLEYNGQKFCNNNNCVYNKYCRSIVDSYKVMHIGKENINLVLE